MGIAVEYGEESTAVCLEGAIDIASAAELKAALLEALERGKAIRVDPGRITELDITAVQLLKAAEAAAKGEGLEFARTAALPEPVIASLRAAGIEIES